MEHITVSPGLGLYLWQESEAEEAFALVDRNREHLTPWVQWVSAVHSGAELQGHIQYALSERQAGRSWQYAIRQEGIAIGGAGLVRRSPFHVELGYWLSAAHAGQGIVTRSCRALADFAFHTLSAQWIEICCAAGNQRSQAVAERLGFHCEELLPLANWTSSGHQDTMVYRFYGQTLQQLCTRTVRHERLRSARSTCSAA